jgi:hypothetical protein
MIESTKAYMKCGTALNARALGLVYKRAQQCFVFGVKFGAEPDYE